MQLTGAEPETVLELLEEALEAVLGADLVDSGSYPYAAGIRYDINVTASFGVRLSNLEINPALNDLGSWTQIDVVALSDFHRSRGH